VKKEKALRLKPFLTYKGYADAAQEPKFTTSPAKAMPKALEKAGIAISDVDYFEFNEAFAVVGFLNELEDSKVNVNGGAASLDILWLFWS
jgi:acetyl-CoA C-acetyltransferase